MIQSAAILLIGASLSLSANAAPIHACVSDVDLPPYAYLDSTSTSSPPAIHGLAVDMLQYALKSAKQAPAIIERFPWNRCLALVAQGDMDLVLNVPTAQIDPAPFYISQPYTLVHSVYYYSQLSWPKGIKITDLEDLKRYHVCGLLGNRYEAYGIDTRSVDTGANNYESLIAKLNAGHCDLFLEKREVIAGLVSRNPNLKQAFKSPGLKQVSLPEDEPLGLHFAVSRHMPNGQEFAKQLNLSITEVQRNKLLQSWLIHYLNQPAGGVKKPENTNPTEKRKP